MNLPHTTLEQWRAFQAVIEHGGFAQAAKALHRSQSAVSYAVSRLQEQLGVNLLRIEGRKAQLTDIGQVMLTRSRNLLASATELEALATNLKQGWEAEVQLVVDNAFPNHLLFQALKAFETESHGTQVLLSEVILSGAEDAILSGQADLVIGVGFTEMVLSDPLLNVDFVAVAHPDHPLHQVEEALTVRHLQNEQQVIIRDSGQRRRNVGWMEAKKRWTVSSIDTATEAIVNGLGFAWLPRHKITDKLENGQVKILNLREGQVYHAQLYMAFAQASPGPGTRLLAEKIREAIALNTA